MKVELVVFMVICVSEWCEFCCWLRNDVSGVN
jgi:hypothetical protein